MELFEQLTEVLDKKLLEEMVDGAVNLRDPQSRMEYQLFELPNATTVIAIDGKMGHLSGLSNRKGLQRVCDYLIVVRPDGEERHYAILVEMKTTFTQEEKHRDQLRRSKPILEYLRELCAVEYGRKPRVSVKYVLVANKLSERLDKQRTRAGPIAGADETYEGIRIRVLIGAGAPFRSLVK
ncbi:hypothetical protein [Candidatus Palauibacter sp.]|uniref:hypothetical protein n=1 Tax=Candidatus Palauibacter sp. TaxID=3101350 RepID=UPI003B5C39B2